jgi:ACS family hexuronate transporter-like MFS transporter
MIAVMLCAAITISYFDRQTLPVAVGEIQKQIPIPDAQFAHLNTAFLLTYGLMYLIGGKLIDSLGTRVGFLLIMLIWSLATAAHGLATTFAALGAARLMLGLGEGGAFPAATKAVAEWFPMPERSTAMGIINAGTAVGGIIAAPAIAAILLHASWPWVFYLSGAAGLLWTGWWFLTYYPPAEHPRISAEEEQLIRELAVPQSDSSLTPIPWLHLLSYVQVWGLVIAKFLTDGVWYFIIFWLPKYLESQRNFNIKQVGYFAWIPWAGAGLGCLVIGHLSSLLVQRGHSLNSARKLAMLLSVAVMPALFFVPFSPTSLVIIPFAVAYFGQQAWSTLIMTIPADLFPRSSVGAVAGLVGFGGAMGGIAFGELVGQMLKYGLTYAPVFAIAGTLHIAAFILVLITIRSVQPISMQHIQSTPLH